MNSNEIRNATGEAIGPRDSSADRVADLSGSAVLAIWRGQKQLRHRVLAANLPESPRALGRWIVRLHFEPGAVCCPLKSENPDEGSSMGSIHASRWRSAREESSRCPSPVRWSGGGARRPTRA